MRCQSIIVAWVLVLSTMALGGPIYADEPAQEAETAKEIKDKDYEMFKLFVDSFEQIDRNYVKEVDRRELMEAAIQGMLRKLDPYSNYISPENLRAFSDSVEQQFGGIGIQVTLDPTTHRLTVAAPLPGAPAQKRVSDRETSSQTSKPNRLKTLILRTPSNSSAASRVNRLKSKFCIAAKPNRWKSPSSATSSASPPCGV